MSLETQRVYRFAQAAHWRTCMITGLDDRYLPRVGAIRPSLPFASVARRFDGHGARAPTVAPTGEVLWVDGSQGALLRLVPGNSEPLRVPVPLDIARATRLVASRWGLWALTGGTVTRFESDSLARLAVLDLSGWRCADIAAARDGLYVLAERDCRLHVLQVDCSGRVARSILLEDAAPALALAHLRHSERFVVLSGGEDPRVSWFSDTGGAPIARRPVASLHRCFSATALGGDGRNRVFVAGMDATSSGGKAFVFAFDGDGEASGRTALDPGDAPPAGVIGSSDALYVAGPRGLLRFARADLVPEGEGERECVLVTPVLQAPARPDGRRWLRIEASAVLPRGASLEISYASTSDPELRDRLVGIASDPDATAGERLRRVLAGHGAWHPPIVFHGDGASSSDAPPWSAPLFDVRDPYLWVCVRLIAGSGAAMPELTALEVLYPGHTLMASLPAIYRRDEAVPGSHLRGLVGVLEATTQDLDARIAALGRHVHPATAPAAWLDSIARWLGLPWDDSLAIDQKRRIVTSANALAATRGTRDGLEAFLACLMPESPRRFRIIDAIADFGFARTSGAGCAHSTLPALLGGLPVSHAELGAGPALGRMRLPCGTGADRWRIDAVVRIDIGASRAERRAWTPWLPGVIEALVPFGIRTRVRWVDGRSRHTRLDGSFELKPPPRTNLDDDAVTGVSRFPDRGERLSACGPETGMRLL